MSMMEGRGPVRIEEPALAAKLSEFIELLESEQLGLLAGATEVDQELLDRIAKDQWRSVELESRTDDAGFSRLDEPPTSKARRATALADAGRAVLVAFFDCPLEPPPSPVRYRWRPPPKRRMVLSCQHGPPEHCWRQLDDGSFTDVACP